VSNVKNTSFANRYVIGEVDALTRVIKLVFLSYIREVDDSIKVINKARMGKMNAIPEAFAKVCS